MRRRIPIVVLVVLAGLAAQPDAAAQVQVGEGAGEISGASTDAEAWTEVPFTSTRWNRDGVQATPVEHLGRSGLRLDQGLLWLPDAGFRDGEIAFDLAVSGERAYVGAVWRIQDPHNAEHFYVRPHQSGKPDSCQYTPVHHGSSAWQLYPESAATISFPTERWMTVRLVVWGDTLQVFLDSDEPRLTTRTRRDAEAGGLGLQASGWAPTHVSRFRYRTRAAPPPGLALPAEERRPGAVATWSVSTAFSAAALAGQHTLPPDLLQDLDWTRLDAEASGLVNLARVQGVDDNADTCLARLTLHAETAMPASIDVGFSDRVKVYLDGALVYEGDDTYRSRDHRFLGTIGLHDRLTLQLEPGPHELLFAVSEAFGGWGLMAALPEQPGLTVAPAP